MVRNCVVISFSLFTYHVLPNSKVKQVTGNDESTEASLKGLLFRLMYDFR